MTSYGKAETERLKQNLENQLERLIEQLEDLENCKYARTHDNFVCNNNFKNNVICCCRGDLEPEEYEETKNDTMEQLKELNESLNKLVKGDISLISALGTVQLVTTFLAFMVKLKCVQFSEKF